MNNWARIANICRLARLENKTSQQQLAQKYGHKQQSISRFESGLPSFAIFDYMREYPAIVEPLLKEILGGDRSDL